jgi:carbohydrate-selective porin OprB
LFWWNLTVKQDLWEKGQLIVKARGGNTDGHPPNGITPLVGSKLNVDWAAYETALLYVANVYLKQKLFDDKLMLAFGKITFPNYFDENKIGSWNFFSHSLARNQVFPHRYHTLGALVRYDWTEAFYLQGGITDGDGIRDETGLNTSFDGDNHWVSMLEAGIKTRTAGGLAGNYRFDIWNDGRELARHDGTGTKKDNVGFGVSFDQKLTEPWGLFFRCGFVDGEVNTFGQYWSWGTTYQEPFAGREKDVVGFGMGQGLTDDDYRTANNATSSETIFELYYKIVFNACMSLQLDCIYLHNTGANAANDDTILPGVRLKAVF